MTDEIVNVIDWLTQLAANARTVNDGEGEPLAERCDHAIAVIRKFQTEHLEWVRIWTEAAAILRNQ